MELKLISIMEGMANTLRLSVEAKKYLNKTIIRIHFLNKSNQFHKFTLHLEFGIKKIKIKKVRAPSFLE
jgi:hypothetical protein